MDEFVAFLRRATQQPADGFEQRMLDAVEAAAKAESDSTTQTQISVLVEGSDSRFRPWLLAATSVGTLLVLAVVGTAMRGEPRASPPGTGVLRPQSGSPTEMSDSTDSLTATWSVPTDCEAFSATIAGVLPQDAWRLVVSKPVSDGGQIGCEAFFSASQEEPANRLADDALSVSVLERAAGRRQPTGDTEEQVLTSSVQGLTLRYDPDGQDDVSDDEQFTAVNPAGQIIVVTRYNSTEALDVVDFIERVVQAVEA